MARVAADLPDAVVGFLPAPLHRGDHGAHQLPVRVRQRRGRIGDALQLARVRQARGSGRRIGPNHASCTCMLAALPTRTGASPRNRAADRSRPRAAASRRTACTAGAGARARAASPYAVHQPRNCSASSSEPSDTRACAVSDPSRSQQYRLSVAHAADVFRQRRGGGGQDGSGRRVHQPTQGRAERFIRSGFSGGSCNVPATATSSSREPAPFQLVGLGRREIGGAATHFQHDRPLGRVDHARAESCVPSADDLPRSVRGSAAPSDHWCRAPAARSRTPRCSPHLAEFRARREGHDGLGVTGDHPGQVGPRGGYVVRQVVHHLQLGPTGFDGHVLSM